MSNNDKAALLEDVSDGEAPCLFDVLKKNPAALAMMQNKLQGMVGLNSGYYDSLPNVVKRRVKALKNIQVDVLKVEAEFAEAVHQLEVKFSEKFQPLYEKRTKIVSGEYEPKDDECDFPSDVEDEEDEEDKQNGKKEETEEEKKKKADEATALHGMDETTKGIPEFWLTIFKNVELIGANIQEHDEPVLAHLTDVQVKLNSRPMGFTLEFHFSPNEYFTDTVLTKEYEIKAEVDPEDPFSFEGAEISKCKGCDIHWKKGKNVTVRSVSKKQKHKSKGNVRTVNKEVPNDSFFNFFSPPQAPEDSDDELDEDAQEILNADFEIGEVIRQRLVQRAVLYFTGEALDEDDYEDEDEEEESLEGETGSDDDEDEDFDPAKAVGKGKKGGNNPEECKQQ